MVRRTGAEVGVAVRLVGVAAPAGAGDTAAGVLRCEDEEGEGEDSESESSAFILFRFPR
jgi:hypothetical protein